MHLLRRVTVAVDHTVGRNDHEGVGPTKQRTINNNKQPFVDGLEFTKLNLNVLPDFLLNSFTLLYAPVSTWGLVKQTLLIQD